MGEALLGVQPPKQAAENWDVSFLSHKFSSHKEAGGKGKIQAGRRCTELHSLRKSLDVAGAAQFPAASCPLPRRDLIAEELVRIMNPTGTWSWEAVPCCWGNWEAPRAPCTADRGREICWHLADGKASFVGQVSCKAELYRSWPASL